MNRLDYKSYLLKAGELKAPLLTLSLSLLISVSLLIWNLSMIGEVIASPNDGDTVESLQAETAILLAKSKELAFEKGATYSTLAELIKSLPTKHGVVVERLNRREKSEKRQTIKLIEVELQGSYEAISTALRQIENSSLAVIDQLTVSEASNNKYLVSLTVTLIDNSTQERK